MTHPINSGYGDFSYSAKGIVYGEDGSTELFAIRISKGRRITEELVNACLESYFDGHRHGFAAGAAAKLGEIKKALEITEAAASPFEPRVG